MIVGVKLAHSMLGGREDTHARTRARTHTYPRKAGFCVFYYCAVLWCAQIVEYIMARWSYSFVCTSHYLIIIIMQTYLKLLNF